MPALFAFALTLLVAVLVSDLAGRSVLSTAVLFLVAGFTSGVLGVVRFDVEGPVLDTLSGVALVSVLFTDGARVRLAGLRRGWRQPAGALLVGLPLTAGGIALAGHVLTQLPWADALVLGAVLCPTDPLFAEALVGAENVPRRLRGLLNVESGLNDGLALPLVLFFLALAARQHPDPGRHLGEGVAGIALGLGVPLVALALRRLPIFGVSTHYEPLLAVATGLLAVSSALLVGANPYLAAFVAGVTLAAGAPELRASFERFGAVVTELLKLATLFVFGTLLTPSWLAGLGGRELVFVLFVLVAVRPVALAVPLARSPLGARERVAAAWFGPRGFASVLYGLLVLRSGLPGGGRIFALVALVVAASTVAHASTDVWIAGWVARGTGQGRGQVPG